jgi:hypothetical protein
MDKWTRLTAEHRDNLVAYLDGELEDNLTQQIDQVLAKSEVARHEVEALARTWELLDFLPKPAAREDFTERTIATLKVSEVRTRLVDQPWFGYVRRGSVGAVWLAGLAVFAVIGFYVTTRAIPTPQSQLLSDLPVVKDLDIYLEVPDLHFVNELQKAGVFSQVDPEVGDAPVRKLDVSPSSIVSHAVLEERADEIAAMPESERQRIRYNWTTFQSLPQDKQAGIRGLHAQIESQPESVHALLATYRVWLQTLTPGQREDLRQADSAERLRLVKEFKDKQDASRETRVFELSLDLQRRVFWPHLNSDNLAAVIQVMESTFAEPTQKRLQGLQDKTERYREVFRVFSTSFRPLTEEQVDEMIDAIGDAQLKADLKSRPSDWRRRSLMFLFVGGLHAHVVEELDDVWPTEEQLREAFLQQTEGERRFELMQMSPARLTSELIWDEYFPKLTDSKVQGLVEFREQLRDYQRNLMMQRDPNRPMFDGRRGFRGPPGPRPSGERPPGDGPRPERPQLPFPPPRSPGEQPNF